MFTLFHTVRNSPMAQEIELAADADGSRSVVTGPVPYARSKLNSWLCALLRRAPW